MEKYIGKSVYKGTAIGPVNVLKKSESLIKRVHVENVDEELKKRRFNSLPGCMIKH